MFPKKNLELYLFITSSSLCYFAEPCIRFGIAWLILKATGSSAFFTTVCGVSLVAEVLAKPLLSPLADYFDRRRVFRAISCSAALACVMLTLTALYLPFCPAALTMLLALIGAANARESAADALIADFAAPTQLLGAQALQSSVQAFASAAGPALAGLLVSFRGPALALTTGTALELIGWLGALLLTRTTQGTGVLPGATPCWSVYRRTMVQRISGGLLCLWRTKAERQVMWTAMCTSVSTCCLVTLIIPVWVAQDLKASANFMALLEVAFAAGLLLGSSFLTRWANRRIGRHRAVILGPLTMGITWLLAAHVTAPLLLVTLLGISGASFPLYFINCGTVRMLATPPEFRARMVGAVGFMGGGLFPLLVPLCGAAIQRVSAGQLVSVCGVLMLLASFNLFLNRTSQRMLQLPEESLVNAYQRLYPEAFRSKTYE